MITSSTSAQTLTRGTLSRFVQLSAISTHANARCDAGPAASTAGPESVLNALYGSVGHAGGMPDYGLALSTMSLANAVFVGLFIAGLVTSDDPRPGDVGLFALGLFWAGLGVFFPIMLIVGSHGEHDLRENTLAALIVSGVLLLATVVVLGFRSTLRQGPVTGGPVEALLLRLLARITKPSQEVVKVQRDIRRKRNQGLKQAVDLRHIRGLPTITRSAWDLPEPVARHLGPRRGPGWGQRLRRR